MEKLINGKLMVTQGDITEIQTDAIVNAANSSLMGGGGVDGAIHNKGGPTILKECKGIRQHLYPDGLPPGRAVITTAGNLSCSYVIHTVGPIWQGGRAAEKDILKKAYKSCLQLATETGITSMAFPAISTGIYGFPKDLAGPIVYKTIQEYLEKNSLPREVFLVFYTQEDKVSFMRSINALL